MQIKISREVLGKLWNLTGKEVKFVEIYRENTLIGHTYKSFELEPGEYKLDFHIIYEDESKDKLSDQLIEINNKHQKISIHYYNMKTYLESVILFPVTWILLVLSFICLMSDSWFEVGIALILFIPIMCPQNSMIYKKYGIEKFKIQVK